MTMKSISSVLSLIFNISCLIGCTYQIVFIFSSYLSYETVTRNKFYSPKYVSFPELHYCFRYLEDAINFDALEAKYGALPPKAHPKKWIDIITIRDIFENTPNVSMTGCKYRDESGHDMIYVDGVCPIFDTSKYVQQQYVCYRLVDKFNNKFRFKFIFNSLYYERVLYEIQFSGLLAEAKKIRTTLTGNNLPYISNQYTPSFYKEARVGFKLQISCSMYINNFLGYSYDNFICQRPDQISLFECIEDCMESASKRMFNNRVPFFSFYDKPIDAKLISRQMFRKEDIRNNITNMYEICRNRCNMHPCKYSYCVTQGHMDATTSYGSKLVSAIKRKNYSASSVIRINSPLSPNVYINYVASIPILDFIIYILSSLGTWFGLVIVNLNPVHLYQNYISKLVPSTTSSVEQNFSSENLSSRTGYKRRHNQVDTRKMRESSKFRRNNVKIVTI